MTSTPTPEPARPRTRAELAVALAALPRPIGLVPTMGALHAGHRANVAAAAERCASVVVSIFVNPLQFGPTEDLARYPRPIESDLAMCAEAGVAAVWTPSVEDMYPAGEPTVRIDPGPLGAELEGAVRPGHFSGVLTVVAKLLITVGPDVAFFGEKDYQQLVLVRRLSADLDLGVQIAGTPTVRDADGLALSSRNGYLSEEQRVTALALNRALAAARIASGRGAPAITRAARQVLDGAALDVDYLAVRSPDLGPAPDRGTARLLVAARVGTTRLIDNAEVVV